MRLFVSCLTLLVALGASEVSAAAGWGFSEATLSVQGKGAGVGGGIKEK